MKGSNLIQSKQIAWAIRKNITLIGRDLNYTQNLKDNLFENLTVETRRTFEKGDGGELRPRGIYPPKMNALHSSSALGVNIFQYWQSSDKVNEITEALGYPNFTTKNSSRIRFEAKYEICRGFPYPPNIDVVIENEENNNLKAIGIESKFSEAYYSQNHQGLKEKYFTDIPDLWIDIPNIFKLATKISSNDNDYRFLYPAQLIKHILGLKKKYGKSSFILFYLWYDVLGYEGQQHRIEIEKFREVVKKDRIIFRSLSYQELIVKLIKDHLKGNEKYVDYISERYL